MNFPANPSPDRMDADAMVVVVNWLVPPLILMIGIALGYLFRAILLRAGARHASDRARQIVEEAERQAALRRREADLQLRDESIRLRENFERDVQARRQDLTRLEENLAQRELNLDRRVAMLDRKEGGIDGRLAGIERDRALVEQQRQDLERAREEVRARLHDVAGLTPEQARAEIVGRYETELRAETGALIRRSQDEARAAAERSAREIIVTAIERYAAAQVTDVTTCVVNLPGDEMKGRIIGREGRNIRSIEAETGCNILIDETPEVAVISGFDPFRREIARQTLERLVADGRIHPARIEEVVAAVREDLDETVRKAGEDAICELGLSGVAPELVRTLGLLKFRHSFSQNVLQHSIEMAHLMQMMASDLGLDPDVAKRVGLFHDIGKAIDHSVEGGHARIGADLLRRHGESALVHEAVGAHHREAEATSPYAALAGAADAITAARPGARQETTEIYLRRLEQLEAVANGFPGIKTAYAIQAGREVRVFVAPDKIDDNEAARLARDISRTIQEKVKYPGQIRITVIRETRCVEYAR